MKDLEEPFVARFRYHSTMQSSEWQEADFVLTRQGDKYQFIDTESGQALVLFDGWRGSKMEFDRAALEYARGGASKYLVLYVNEGKYKYYVWYSDEMGLYDMGGAVWDYGVDSWKYQQARKVYEEKLAK